MSTARVQRHLGGTVTSSWWLCRMIHTMLRRNEGMCAARPQVCCSAMTGGVRLHQRPTVVRPAGRCSGSGGGVQQEPGGSAAGLLQECLATTADVQRNPRWCAVLPLVGYITAAGRLRRHR